MEKARPWLKQYRKNKDMTLQQVADATGFDRSFLGQLETGQRGASVETAKAIANFYGFKWYIFFDEECNKSQQITS